MVPEVVSVVVAVLIWIAAAEAIVTEMVVVPVAANCAHATPVLKKGVARSIHVSRFFMVQNLQVALIEKVTCAENVPVFKVVRLDRVKFTSIVLGSDELHGEPPPVQAEAGTVNTGVEEPVLAVCVPEQLVPKVVPEQV